MQPVCLFIIIVLGFAAIWLILEGSNKASSTPEYYPSGGTATDPHNLMAISGIGPSWRGGGPQYAADLIYPPYNPVANDRIPRVWRDVPGEEGPVQAGPRPAQEEYEGGLGGSF